ncbi:hypothetical protein AC1031_008779 [Aphanomyces cochlioides]|nr:hypothetical protein AC1031_008779 [Aphanomyces cochlioides]
MELVPSKKTIQDAFLGASTRRSYATYQRQFEDYCKQAKGGVDPESATAETCTDFFHHLVTLRRKARTVDAAKTALVAYFKDRNVNPNPAQACESKRYVVGLQKFNRQNNIDDERKAHPLTVHELSLLMNALANYNRFVGCMLRFLFSACFMGCFRISEMLALKWCDVAAGESDKGRYVSIRLRWHKKARVEKDCQVYHLVNETSFPCLRVYDFFEEYNHQSEAFVFPHTTNPNNGTTIVDWFKQMEQMYLRRLLLEVVDHTPELPIGISLHSMRRGGSFYRVFVSPERRFDFRELMAWCRWEDPKTCCEYLVTKSLSDSIDPRNLLQLGGGLSQQIQHVNKDNSLDIAAIVDTVINALRADLLRAQPKTPATRQMSMDNFVVPRAIPTASSGREAWNQWFTIDPNGGYFCAIKDLPKEDIRRDRRKYSERLTLASAFNQYSTYDDFEAAYEGHTRTYSGLLKEVRKRKRNECL